MLTADSASVSMPAEAYLGRTRMMVPNRVTECVKTLNFGVFSIVSYLSY